MKIQSTPNNRSLRGMARGFSLFEMVIVMGIIGVILGGVIYSSRSFGETARIQRTRADFTSLISHLDSYKMLGSRGYPNQSQGLQALVTKPSTSPVPKDWTQSLRELPVDGWGNTFQYKMPGTQISNEPEIISSGVDGVFGNDDDLSSQDQ